MFTSLFPTVVSTIRDSSLRSHYLASVEPELRVVFKHEVQKSGDAVPLRTTTNKAQFRYLQLSARIL